MGLEELRLTEVVDVVAGGDQRVDAMSVADPLQLGWNLFFGPIISSLPPLALALGVFLLQRKEAAASPSPAVPVSPKPLAPRRRQGRRSQRTRRRYLAGGPQRA